jgi:hypothetical protein
MILENYGVDALEPELRELFGKYIDERTISLNCTLMYSKVLTFELLNEKIQMTR